MPPIIQILLWFHFLRTRVADSHCNRIWWFYDWHYHFTMRHFECQHCRRRYVQAFDKAVGAFFA